jgi:hypothetical protein
MDPGIQEEIHITLYLLTGSCRPVDERIGNGY